MYNTMRIALLMTVFLVPSSVAQLGTVRIGAYTVDGDIVTVPIVLEGDVGEGVAAMDFRLRYDAEVFEPIAIETGQAVADADKLVQTNLVRPGEYIFLMFGMNQTVLTSGDLAQVTMRVIEAPETGRTRLTVTNTTMSTADATALDSRGTGRTIRFDGGLPAEPSPPEPEPSADDDPSEPAAPAGQPEDPASLGADDSAAGRSYRDARVAGGGLALRRAPANAAKGPQSSPYGSRSSGLAGSAERLGNVKDVIDKIREADNLRSQLPRAGTGDSENEDVSADDGGGTPGEASKSPSPPSAPSEVQGAETTVAKAPVPATPWQDGAQAGGKGEASSPKEPVDARPTAQSDGSGRFPLGLALLGFGTAAVAGVIAFRRKFLS